MGTSDFDSLSEKLVTERLLHIPADLTKYVPPVLLKEDLDFKAYKTSDYFLFFCTDGKTRKYLGESAKRGFEGFPHLVTTHKFKKSMFSLDKSKNVILTGGTFEVGTGYVFYVGQDSSLIITDISVVGADPKLGPFQYNVELAFIISFGREIRYSNFSEVFGDLVAYALKAWKSAYVPK